MEPAGVLSAILSVIPVPCCMQLSNYPSPLSPSNACVVVEDLTSSDPLVRWCDGQSSVAYTESPRCMATLRSSAPSLSTSVRLLLFQEATYFTTFSIQGWGRVTLPTQPPLLREPSNSPPIKHHARRSSCPINSLAYRTRFVMSNLPQYKRIATKHQE